MDINATLLGQAITFAVLIWFTMKFVWPPLTNMIDERTKRIADGLAAGERGKLRVLLQSGKMLLLQQQSAVAEAFAEAHAF